jgi:hypothetical protein
MEDQNNSSKDQLPKAIGSGDAGDGGKSKPPDSIDPYRRARIRQHLAAGLLNPSPLEAVLSSINADLMTIEMNVAKAILKDASQRPINLQDVEEQSPAISLLIRLVKQTVQVTQLGMHLSRARTDHER